MVEYLKKKALYEIAQNLSSEELPKCKDFIYSYSRGVEWMECSKYKISSQACGCWICIRHQKYDEVRDEYYDDQYIFSHPINGEYTYRSHYGKQVIIDNFKNTEGQNYEKSYSNSKSEGWCEQNHHHSQSRGRTR